MKRVLIHYKVTERYENEEEYEEAKEVAWMDSDTPWHSPTHYYIFTYNDKKLTLIFYISRLEVEDTLDKIKYHIPLEHHYRQKILKEFKQYHEESEHNYSYIIDFDHVAMTTLYTLPFPYPSDNVNNSEVYGPNSTNYNYPDNEGTAGKFKRFGPQD